MKGQVEETYRLLTHTFLKAREVELIDSVSRHQLNVGRYRNRLSVTNNYPKQQVIVEKLRKEIVAEKWMKGRLAENRQMQRELYKDKEIGSCNT